MRIPRRRLGASGGRGDPEGSEGLLRVYVSDVAFSGFFHGFGDCAVLQNASCISLDEVRARVV
jgi:hypothetical protein